VKPPIFTIISCGLSLAVAGHASTTPEPHHLQPNAPRTVIVSEADTPPVIRAGLLQSTLILLPQEEKLQRSLAAIR
jgi:type IV secretion system protein VirB9